MNDAVANVDALIKKVINLRSAGNLDEAIICGKAATREAPENANAWWQLGHALAKKHGLASAIECFEKTCEFAPSFAEGWCQLGLAYEKAGRLDDAVDSYQMALLNDEEHTRTLKLLAAALKTRDIEDDPENRLELLRKLEEIGELDDSERFDLAFALNKNKEYHKAQRIYQSHYLITGTAAAANNLGVAYSRQGKNLDALDCYRLANKAEPDDELYEKNVSITLDKINKYEISAIRKPIVIDSREFYRNYLNPYVLMGFKGKVDYTDIKAIQKYKKALYQEIKLEDGKVSWLSNHEIDISAAMDICEKLNDDSYAALQKEIYENTSLCDFLMTGDLQYFLSKNQASEKLLRVKLQPYSDFINAISSVFAAQFDMVLCKALEQKNFEAARCMLGGRWLVRDEDIDVCFSGAKKLIDRMLEPIKKLADEAESSTVDIKTAKATCAKDSIHLVLSYLPSEFIELQRNYYGYLFTISKEIYRDGGGVEAALDIVELAAPIALVCVDVSDRLSNAKEQLNGLLAEEKKNEVHLTVNSKKLDITKHAVEYGDQKILTEEIRGLKWGIVLVSNNPKTAEFSFGISSIRGREIIVSWKSSSVEPQREFWEGMINALLRYCFQSAYKSFEDSLNTGSQVSIGGVSINSRGVNFLYESWFSKKSLFAPWSAVKFDIDNGDLVLQAKTERKAIVRMPLASTWNAVVLNYYLKKLED